MFKILATTLSLFAFIVSVNAEKVSFKAADGLEITADLQKPEGSYSTVIVLFHMAGASRGEYRDIAPVLNKLGYATLAVDQRSGRAFNGVKNETAARGGGNVAYAKAIPDLKAASSWVRSNTGARQVGVLGSSYSSALVLALAGQDRDFADAVMSFSPGEYFGDKQYVRKSLSTLEVPVFITSAKNETGNWKKFLKDIKGTSVGFVPKGSGRHGATALISKDGDEYWAALKTFLAENLPAK